ELFEHEKLHYMIAALVGAELEQELKALSAPTYPALLLAQKQLAQEKGERARDIEQQYDDDTNHWQITAQRILWSARVCQWRRAGAKPAAVVFARASLTGRRAQVALATARAALAAHVTVADAARFRRRDLLVGRHV